MRIPSSQSLRLPLAPIARPAGADRRRDEADRGDDGAQGPRPGPGILPPGRVLVAVLPLVPYADAIHAARAYRSAAAGPHPLPPGTMLRIAV